MTYETNTFRGDIETHRVLVIEYHDGKPHAVITDHGTFDFDWCERDEELVYHESGGGIDDEHHVSSYCKPSPPPCQIWAAPGVKFFAYSGTNYRDTIKVPVSDAELLARGYERVAEPLVLPTFDDPENRNPFKAGDEHDGQVEYCGLCKTHMADTLCRHLYRPECGDTVGAGGEEPDLKSFFAALDWLESVEDWREWPIWKWSDPLVERQNALLAVEANLLSKKPRRLDACSRGIEDKFVDTDNDDGEDTFNECESGLGWLTTLGPDTPEANAKTLKWIMEWRLSRGERAEAKERAALIKQLKSLATDENRDAILKDLGLRPNDGQKAMDKVPTERIREVVGGIKAEVATV